MGLPGRVARAACATVACACVAGAYPAAPRPRRVFRRRVGAARARRTPEESPLATSARVDARWVAPEDWVPDRDSLDDDEAARAVPLYVLDSPLVPGTAHSVDVRADDAGLNALYDDLLLRGGRTVVTTMGVREEDGGDAAALGRYGCKMTLERVRDASGATSGKVRWFAEHELGRDRVRVDKVVGRSEGDASYLSCVFTEAPDAPLSVAVGAAAVVTRGKHAGVTGSIESVDNGWIRLRTPAGELVAARGRESVDVLDGGSPPPRAEARAAKVERDSPLGEALGAALATLESTGADLRDLLDQLKGGGDRAHKKDAPPPTTAAGAPPITPAGPPAGEAAVLAVLADIASLQASLDEDVRFNGAALSLLGAGRGTGVGSLWHLADACWLSYQDSRAAARKKRLHGDLNERLLEYLDEAGKLPDDGKPDRADESTTLALSELPRDLRSMLTTLDERVADDLEPISAAKAELQRLLDADDHDARCDAFAAVLGQERARLRARAALKSLFGKDKPDTVPLPDMKAGDDDDDDDDAPAPGFKIVDI